MSAECGAGLDATKTLREAGFVYLGRGPTCERPPGHDGLHSRDGMQWSEPWARR